MNLTQTIKNYKIIILRNFLEKWILLWVFLFSISVVSYHGHGGQSALILLITSIYLIVKEYKLNSLTLGDKEERIFLYLVLAWFGWQLFGVIYQPIGFEYNGIREKLSAFDNSSRWILLLPLFFIFKRFYIDFRIVLIGLACGSIFAVIFSYIQVYHLGFSRAEGFSNHPITFAEMMVIVDILLWVSTVYYWQNNNKILSLFLFVSSIISFYGSLLSVTRGAWVVYIFMILLWIIYIVKNKSSLSKSLFARFTFMAIALFLVSKTEQYEVLEVRTSNAINYASKGDLNNASGGRLLIYKNSLESVKKYPFGVGTNNFRKIEQAGQHYGHAHNEALNILVETGVQGLTTFVFFILWTGYFFWKNLKNNNKLIRLYSMCGLLLIGSYGIFGQTQAIFNHHQTLIFFIFFLYLFFAQIKFLKRQDSLVSC